MPPSPFPAAERLKICTCYYKESWAPEAMKRQMLHCFNFFAIVYTSLRYFFAVIKFYCFITHRICLNCLTL
jgi:hypothetical protein